MRVWSLSCLKDAKKCRCHEIGTSLSSFFSSKFNSLCTFSFRLNAQINHARLFSFIFLHLCSSSFGFKNTERHIVLFISSLDRNIDPNLHKSSSYWLKILRITPTLLSHEFENNWNSIYEISDPNQNRAGKQEDKMNFLAERRNKSQGGRWEEWIPKEKWRR